MQTHFLGTQVTQPLPNFTIPLQGCKQYAPKVLKLILVSQFHLRVQELGSL